MDIKITVVRIKGTCPVFTVGNVFVLKSGYILDTNRSCPVCMHALTSLMPFYTALKNGIEPVVLGLAPEAGKPARIQCPDPCEYTGGGTVVFEITR